MGFFRSVYWMSKTRALDDRFGPVPEVAFRLCGACVPGQRGGVLALGLGGRQRHGTQVVQVRILDAGGPQPGPTAPDGRTVDLSPYAEDAAATAEQLRALQQWVRERP